MPGFIGPFPSTSLDKSFIHFFFCSKKIKHLKSALSMVEEDGFEPSKSTITDLQSAPFGHSGIPPYFFVVLAARIELATYWLQVSCSTCWAMPAHYILLFCGFLIASTWISIHCYKTIFKRHFKLFNAICQFYTTITAYTSILLQKSN